MKQKTISIITGLFLLAALTYCGSNNEVKFQTDSSINLTGKLIKPEGSGPFPAVILMHGCGGVGPVYETWAGILKDSGFAVFILDSFKGRGVKTVCGKPNMAPTFKDRIQDAFDAQKYLAGLAYIDPKNISLIGWSHGGVSVLHSSVKKSSQPFKKIVAFYPYCKAIAEENVLYSPVLVLIGAKDDWTPSKLCVDAEVKLKEKKQPFSVTVYPNATHAFDFGVDRELNGHMMKSDPEATTDARKRVVEFLKN